MNKALYKPLGMVVSALGGFAASMLFKQVWKRATGNEDAPRATDRDYSWRQVLLAATVQGAIFGAVKAAVDRASAAGYRKATGKWPDD
ncbi:DUF4235 domain-containing protein [Amycolatopsis anabasis]|uniref:DUF4235 domain-containing protein n=1 Tax=Amycolatopsis anabasis TaxID=1840409 RepID=UPI00131E72BA|nr:DUF4235 domain-containing protein [Amycolatopsis anabasis]